jgi:hypothetical protein
LTKLSKDYGRSRQLQSQLRLCALQSLRCIVGVASSGACYK